MEDSKLPQRKFTTLRRVLFLCTLFVVVVIGGLFGLFNSSSLQQRLFHHYVSPGLVKNEIDISFSQLKYVFPNSFKIDSSSLSYRDTILLELGTVYIDDLDWIGGIKIQEIRLEALNIKRSIEDPWVTSLLDEFNAAESSQSVELLPFKLAVDTWKLQSLEFFNATDTVNAGINGLEFVGDPQEIRAQKLNISLQYRGMEFFTELDRIDVSSGYEFSAVLRIRENDIGLLSAEIKYSMDSSSVLGEVVLVNEPIVPYPNMDVVEEFLSGSRLTFSGRIKENMIYGNMSIDQSLYNAQGQLEWNIDSAVLSAQAFAYPSTSIYTTDLLKGYSDFWNQFSPESLDVQLKTDFKELMAFEIVLNDGVNSASVAVPHLNEPVRIHARLPQISLGPLTGLELKSVIYPDLKSVMAFKEFKVNTVSPELVLNDSIIKGLSFSYVHAEHLDSIWLSCLDDQLDLDGYAILMDERISTSLHLNQVGLYLFDPLDTAQYLSADLQGDFTLDGNGYVKLSDLLLERANDVVFMREFQVTHVSSRYNRSFAVQSDVLTGFIEGQWDFKDVIFLSDQVVQHVIGQKNLSWEPSSFKFEINAGSTDWLTDLLHLNAHLSQESYLFGLYDGPNNRWSITADVPKFQMGKISANDFYLNSSQIIDENSTAFRASQIDYGNNTLDTVFISSQGAKLEHQVEVLISLRDSIPSTLDLRANYGKGWAEVIQSDFNIGKSDFSLNKSSIVKWNQKLWSIDSLGFNNSEGELWIDTKEVGPNKNITNVHLSGVESELLNYIIRDPDAVLSGQLSLNATASNSLSSPALIANIVYDDFGLNDTYYGRFTSNLQWNDDGHIFSQGQLLNKGESAFNYGGHYDIEDDEIDIRVSLNDLDISAATPFLHGVMTNLRGKLEGGISIYGPRDEWNISGSMVLKNGQFNIPSVGSELSTMEPADIRITNTIIELDSTQFYVPADSTLAWAWGSLSHNNFKDLNFDIHLQTDSIRAVDMSRKMDSYFYGVAIASGDLTLEGPIEQLHLDLSLETKEGTNFKIPLDNPTAVETPSFIHFIGQDKVVIDPTVDPEKLEYFTTDIAISATEDAQIELVLDEVLGDVIKTTGVGNLRLKILEDESLEMFGLYTVSAGSYLFTLQNIINKKFTLLPEGTILWSGDLYEADVNLEAKYSLSTSLQGLVTSSGYNGENVDVDLIILLKGALMSPEISFRVELPNAPSSYSDELQRHFLNDDAMNYQAFSLLMLGEFFKQDLAIQESINLGSSVSKTTSEFLVSEFGSWLTAGIGSYVDLELDYTSGVNPYNNLTNTGNNLNLGVSKNFFDGRLKVNSSLDIPIAQDGNSTLLLGDTEIAYSITKDGRIVLKAFNRSNRNDPLLQNAGPYTQGVGIQFHKEFERLEKTK